MVVNLYYVRAAIEANTGQRLSFPKIRRLLVEEGLLTEKQAREDARAFNGYDNFFASETFHRDRETKLDLEEGLPDDWTNDY